MTDNQERENFYHSLDVYEGFISPVSLLNDLMKILVGLSILNRVIFKGLGSDFIEKIVFLNRKNSIC